MHFPSFSKIEQQVSPVSKPTNRNKDSTFASIPNLYLSVNVTRNEQVPIRVVIDTEYNGIVSFEMFLCNSLYTISCKRNQMEEWQTCQTYGVDIPYPYASIVRCRSEEDAIWGPCDIGVACCMATQVADYHACEGIPYFDHIVCAYIWKM
jgi:hypothetical protein